MTVRNSIARSVSFDDTNQGPNGFKEAFFPGHISPSDVAPKQQAIQHIQPLSDLSLGSISSTTYHHANPGTDVSISQFVSVDINAY